MAKEFIKRGRKIWEKVRSEYEDDPPPKSRDSARFCDYLKRWRPGEGDQFRSDLDEFHFKLNQNSTLPVKFIQKLLKYGLEVTDNE